MSGLVGNPENRFSQNEVQYLLLRDRIAEQDLMPASEVAVAVYLPTSVSDTDDILSVWVLPSELITIVSPDRTGRPLCCLGNKNRYP